MAAAILLGRCHSCWEALSQPQPPPRSPRDRGPLAPGSRGAGPDRPLHQPSVDFNTRASKRKPNPELRFRENTTDFYSIFTHII